MLRRGVKEYDRFLIAKHVKSQQARTASPKSISDEGSPVPPCSASAAGYRPTILEQAIRALLHMLQFAVAYFVMLYARTLTVFVGSGAVTDAVAASPCTTMGTSSSASSLAPTWAASSSTGSRLEGKRLPLKDSDQALTRTQLAANQRRAGGHRLLRVNRDLSHQRGAYRPGFHWGPFICRRAGVSFLFLGFRRLPWLNNRVLVRDVSAVSCNSGTYLPN